MTFESTSTLTREADNRALIEPQASVGTVRICALLIGLAIALRIAIAAFSIGTNDAVAFAHFADEITTEGLTTTYQIDPRFNHPPLIGLWAVWTWRLAIALPLRGWDVHKFAFLFRLPIIAADGLGIWLLWRIWRPRIGPAKAAAIAAGFAWSLDAILVSGFHCNTDPIYVALCLLAVYLMDDRRAIFCAGLALGAAINVKLIPVLLVGPLLLSCRDRKEAWRFVSGLALAAIPFLPVLFYAGPDFFRHAVAYNSGVNRWGINYFLLLGKETPAWTATSGGPAAWYHGNGRYLLFGLIALWAAAARTWSRWNRYEIAAVTLALFLVFTPGFGVQYTVAVGLLMFAVRPRVAMAYATVSGLFLLNVYLNRKVPDIFPPIAVFDGAVSPAEATVGCVAWAMAAYFILTTLFPRSPVARAPSHLGCALPNAAATAA